MGSTREQYNSVVGKSKRKNKKSGKYQQISSDNDGNSRKNDCCIHDSNRKISESGNTGKGKGKGKNNDKMKSKIQNNHDDYSFRQKLTNNGEREIVDMIADGNCLFRSISHQLHNDFGQRHALVGEEICDFLEQNEDDFKVYLFLEETDVCEFNNYVDQMRKDGEWGGDVEIVCAVRLYK